MELMCPIKEPLSLKEVALNGLKKLFSDFLSVLIENNLKHSNDFWQNEAPQWFGEQILDGVPHTLADEVFAALEEVWQMDIAQMVFEGEKMILVLSDCIESVLLKLNVSKISLEGEKYEIIAPILDCLPSMPQLQHLCLFNLHNCHDDFINYTLLLEGLECLPNLKVFMFDKCTDEMLRVLSKNCLVLEHVKLCFKGKTVSSKSIRGLADCKRLRYIFMQECVLPAEDFASLIISLSSLQEVDVLDMDKVMDVIEKKQQKCFLKAISCRIKVKHLRTVNVLCNQVHKLVLNLDRAEDLNVRYKLQNLGDLWLTKLDYSNIRVLPSILEIANLKSVTFFDAETATENALRVIADNCPNLETLIVHHINVIQCERTIEFLKVSFLKVHDVDSFEFLIHFRCPSLKSVVMNHDFSRDTEVVEEFLHLNAKSCFRKVSSETYYGYTTRYTLE